MPNEPTGFVREVQKRKRYGWKKMKLRKHLHMKK